MNEKFNLEFSFVELQIILKGLEELPYKQSAPVRENIINQWQEVQIAKEKAAKEDTADKPTKAVKKETPKK